MSEEKTRSVESEGILQLVSFKIGAEEFGVDILGVQEIIKMMKLTEVPNAPEFVDGVVNLRSKIIPVVDLRSRLGLNRSAHSKDTRIIVLELLSNTIGFIVDEVSEVLRIPKNITEPPPSLLAGINSEVIFAIAKLEDRLLILIDLNKIFNINEVRALRDVA